jgi:hypothetical protein
MDHVVIVYDLGETARVEGNLLSLTPQGKSYTIRTAVLGVNMGCRDCNSTVICTP